MDADIIERQRDQLLSRREKRWSMNSQRLEEIVAELMKPISDVRRSFDTDLSALLEEYLTEAGLRALDVGEDSSAEDAVAPNFAELALLLQQSASIYGRKVDFLYDHVLSVVDSLHNSTQATANTSTSDEPQTPSSSTGRRKRKASTCGDFSHVALEPSGSARRAAELPRPPPTLPRMYVELEPRVLARADAPLRDYAGEPVGLLADFHVAWRLHEGFLVDELEGATSGAHGALRPISLVELQAAIEAAAPPPLPPALHGESPARDASSPLRASTPLPPPAPPAPPSPPDHALFLSPPAKRERKRRSNVNIDDIFEGNVKIVIGSELRQKLSEVREFSISERWISRIVAKRKKHILSERLRLRAEDPDPPPEFGHVGLDLVAALNAGGFPGWSSAEAASATAAAKGSARLAEPDSDDDGFFELSSVGDSDASRADEPDGAAWAARVLRRAAAAAARGALDVRLLGARVLAALPARAARPAPFADVLRDHATEQADVSRLFLTTLFLANAGNVELVQGAPLSVDSFSVRLLSSDERLYGAVAAAEAQLQR